MSMGDASDGDIESEALEQTQNSPLYKSEQLEEKTFQGVFVPLSNDTKVAILSDDGATVHVRLEGGQWPDQPLLARKGQGQHLPNLSASLRVLDYTWVAGQRYEIKVEYSNTIYRGTFDIDGVTLFAYNGGGMSSAPGFVYLDGTPLRIISPFGASLVDNAIALQDIDQNDPVEDWHVHPIHLTLDLPAAFDAEAKDTVTVHLVCRSTGQTAQLALQETENDSLVFQDNVDEETAEIQIVLADSDYSDDPKALHAQKADVLSVHVTSYKFGKRFTDYVSVHETGNATRKFKDASISGTITLSAAGGENRTLTFTGKKDSTSWQGAVLSESQTEANYFSNADMNIRFLSSSETALSDDLSQEHNDKLLGVFNCPAQNITNEIIFLVENGPASLAFVGTVPDDSGESPGTAVAFAIRQSGRPTPAATPTLDDLDGFVEDYKAYRVRVPATGDLPQTVQIKSLDLDGGTVQVYDAPLAACPGQDGFYVTQDVMLPFGGDSTEAFCTRYGEDGYGYYLLQAGRQNAATHQGQQAKRPTLAVFTIGDSLGAAMQSFSMYERIQNKGFSPMTVKALGQAHRMPAFSDEVKRKWLFWKTVKRGWPATPYIINNDEPAAALEQGKDWGLFDLDAEKDKIGFTPGERLDTDNSKVHNVSVPGFEIQNLSVTTGALKQVSTGENPNLTAAPGTYTHRHTRTNMEIVRDQQKNSIQVAQARLPHVLIVSMSGNDLLEAVTDIGDPDGPVRNDNDGGQPMIPPALTEDNVTWDANKTDVPLQNGKPNSAAYPQHLDFGEFCTKPSIYDAKLRGMLDDLENAYKTSQQFANVQKKGDKPVIVLSLVPDVTKIGLLLPASKAVQTVGQLSFVTKKSGVGKRLTWWENIQYQVDANAAGTYTLAKARVSFLRLITRATETGSEFDNLPDWVRRGNKSKKSTLNGNHTLAPIVLKAEDVLSDGEIDFVLGRKTDIDNNIKEIERKNRVDGDWPHLRVVVVDPNEVYNHIPNGFDATRNGGMFSLDMLHPSSQGQKLVANEYIKKINSLIQAGEFFDWKPGAQAAEYTWP
jgi:hypothetical protein